MTGLLVVLLAWPAVARDPLVMLGSKLFFDPRLSASGRTACASCHDPNYGYALPSRVSISDNGQIGRRNPPSLLDVRVLPRLMWDGRFPSLEHQVFGPFASGEMGLPIDHAARRLNADPEYRHLFGVALEDRPSPDGMARAIAAFERTIISRESRVDRFLVHNDSSALSSLELHGFDVFTRRAQCTSCHHLFPTGPDGRRSTRPLFTDFRYHSLGVGFGPRGFADRGRYKHTSSPFDRGVFRTPSLRNSARTPPYMHDGSLATLREVVEFYDAGAQPNPNLSPLIQPLHLQDREKAALIAFLRAMAD
jgi:cytochrome c peroxidase